jgi:hypothetical protein
MPQSSFHSPALDTWVDKVDDYARAEPMKAVASAFGAGFLLNLLPIGAIIGALVSIALSLFRPAFLFLGLLKAFELCNEKNHTSKNT